MALCEMPILVEIGMEADDAATAIRRLADVLVRSGHVTEGYAAAVIDREAIFPTALPTEPPVALPHADPDHVLHSAMAVGVFRAPVAFDEMGNPGRTLQVQIVFLLALREKEEAAGLLRELAIAFRDSVRLTNLKEALTPQEARRALSDLLSKQPAQ